MSEPVPRLSIAGLCKSYAAPVLRGVDLAVAVGEVHALVGENGAGKSTLARIVAGLAAPDAGEMRLDGARYEPRGKQEAAALGVRMVQQELALVPTLSVAENILLGAWPNRLGWIDRAALTRKARVLMGLVGLRDVDPDERVGTLGIGQQQLVEIAAALADLGRGDCRLLVLDEPTAALTRPEAELLFAQIRRLRAAGTSLIYISHRLEEIGEIADRVTVLRDGAMVGTWGARELAAPEIVRHMVGREVSLEGGRRPDERACPAGAMALRVTSLSAPPAVRNVSFEARRGEILGFAGLMGAGRTEAMRAIFGADPRAGGEIVVGAHGEAAPMTGPAEAVVRGLAFVSEDRKGEGLLLPLTVRANMTLACLPRFAVAGFVGATLERDATLSWMERLTIRARGPEQPVVELSGGNQQKVAIARWLLHDADIFILDEPTRGIDVAARFEIYRVLRDLAAAGKAVLVVSSDMKELMHLCDRIAVLSLGELVATFAGDEISEEAIMTAALSNHRRAPARGAS